MNEAATPSHPAPRPAQGRDGQMGLEEAGELSQSEPQTCACRDVKRLVQRHLPSRSAGDQDASPALLLAGQPSETACPASSR